MGGSTVLAGALIFGAAGTAQAEPMSAPVVPTASAQVSPAAVGTDTAPDFRRWCKRQWHKPSWFWFHGKRHVKPGYWSCGSPRNRWHR